MSEQMIAYLGAAIMSLSFGGEYLFSRFIRSDHKHDTRDSVTAALTGAGYAASIIIRGFVLGTVMLWTYRHAPVQWDTSDPLTWLAGLLVVDCFYYWSHRTSHAFSFLWALHAIHHTSPKFNLGIGYRNSWFGGYIDWVFVAAPVFCGFSPMFVSIAITLISAWDFWCHSAYIGRIPVLDAFMNTPSNHRVHHSADIVHQQKNFGGLLFVWDRIFGSYRRQPDHGLRYGLEKEPVRPHNPVYLQLFLVPWLGRRLWREQPQRLSVESSQHHVTQGSTAVSGT